MALDVYNALEASSVKESIQKYPKSYLLGSNGPDILFYYKAFPWEDQKDNKAIAAIGSLVHEKHINSFYGKALSFIKQVQDPHRKDILTSYLAGHMMHWSLDSIAHPFVFYRSGEIAGISKYWHYRYESMIDALMVTYYKRKQLSDLKAKRFVDVSDVERRHIASFYSEMLSQVFDVIVSAEVIDSAIVSFKRLLNFLYDPHNLVTPLLKGVEAVIGDPWAFSSHSVNPRIDAEFDVLNLKKDKWFNPTNLEMVSDESFIELYEASVDLGNILISALEEGLDGKRDNFDEILEDRQYDTGVTSGIKMKYYDSIYEK